MQLIYRGYSYDYIPPISKPHTELSSANRESVRLIYRGYTYDRILPLKKTQISPAINWRYRF